MKKRVYITLVFFLLICGSLASQSHAAVPLEDSIYLILEQAQIRGLINTLPAVKPYTRLFIAEAIEKILESNRNRLSYNERLILERELEKFKPRHDRSGMDLRRGSYSFNSQFLNSNTRFSSDLGLGLQMAFSGAYYDNDDIGTLWGMDNQIHAYIMGDIGESFGYNFNFYGAIVRAPRRELGTYNTFYEGISGSWDDAINREITVHSQPLTFFPYDFRKDWDGGYFLALDNLSETGFIEWPDGIGIGPHFISELSGSHFNNALTWRFGRVRREWAAMSTGRSLALNGMAQPFLGIEASFRPVSWFGFSAMTGALEYVPIGGDQFVQAWGSQTLFSIEQIELNYKNYFHFGLGTTSIWGKRLELGYLFPLTPNFFYQATVGNFDNTGLFLNLRGQYPGFGRLWFSLFIEDMVPATLTQGTFWELDWNMYAYQVGAKAPLPWFGSFTNALFSYTKNEPYNYTHRRMFVPWHNSITSSGDIMPLETNYVNNGVSLGYYIPPNSYEFLFRLETMITSNSSQHFQYQLIRHGATHGPSAVDGSHLFSELDPNGRMENPVLRKFFLKDGAYQWQNIFRLGGEYLIPRLTLPIRVFGEFGVVYSYYTDIDGPANSGSASSYKVIDTIEYPTTTGFIGSIGFRLFL